LVYFKCFFFKFVFNFAQLIEFILIEVITCLYLVVVTFTNEAVITLRLLDDFLRGREHGIVACTSFALKIEAWNIATASK